MQGFGGHSGHHGGKGSARNANGARRLIYRGKKSSRRLFKDFILTKGMFGYRKTQEDIEKEAKDQERRGEKPDEKKKSRKSYLLRYLREFRDQKARLVLLLVMSVLAVVLHAAFPWSSKFIIDFVLARRDFGLLVISCGLLLVIGLSEVILNLVRDYTTRSLLGNFSAGIKRRMMRHLQQMPLERLQDLKVGGIISRLQSDTEQLAGLLQQGVLSPFNALLMFSIAVVSMFMLMWKVTLVCLVFCVVVGVVAYFMFNVMRPFYRLLREDRALISGHLTETFSGIEVVRAFLQERAETRDFSVETHYLWRKSLHGQLVGMSVHRLVWTLFWVMRVVIWLYGGYHVIQGTMTLGALITFNAFVQWLFQPIFMIMHSISHLQMSMACAERVFDLLDEPVAMPEKPGAVDVEKLEGEIRFDNVSFKYPDGSYALSGVNLVIPRGKITALVGPSGAGKSTITNLVMRFYDITEGRITMDGVDIREIKRDSYRKLLSLVLQDVFLFDGPIRDNIAFGKPDATMEQIVEAAKISNCSEFISEIDDGYDAVIGERGVKLSGGQKQRIALARAVLMDPQLLILDEATSNLDSESEALIQDALEHILKNRTTLAIAHRFSTIMDADNIVVMDKGEIREQGTHEQLLGRRGRYYEMFSKQMEKTGLPEAFLEWEEGNGKAEGGTGKAERGTGKAEGGTGKAEGGTGKAEGGTGKAERGTGNGEGGTPGIDGKTTR